MSNIAKYSKPKTLLNIQLSTKQHIYVNYILPVVFTSLIYIFNFAADSVLALQHRRDENYLFGSITLLWLYVPVVTCFGLTVSNLELWPGEGFDPKNIKWLIIMILQHFLFPIWAMGRFAEQLFWSIEAVRSENDDLEELLANAERNSIFELYHFLQAYLQAVPQILFQLHIIFRQPTNFEKSTVDMQVFCVFMSFVKMAMTTMAYQRFKTQKLAGRQYPWIRRNLQRTQAREVLSQVNRNELVGLVPTETNMEDSETEADRQRRGSGLSVTSSQFNEEEIRVDRSEDVPDIRLPIRLERGIRALTEDDVAGKLVSFFWWFCFLLPRMLALSAFAYFYPKDIWWVTVSHYIITLAFLLYDARISDMPYNKAIFLLFTSYVFMFCLIEFKIKFKKVKFIYIGYFILVYFENFLMTFIWYFDNNTYDTLNNGWWFQYVFYLILISSILSSVSMFLYVTTLKPAKVLVERGEEKLC